MTHPGGFSANQPDVYNTNSKQILVTRDPVYNHPAVRVGRGGETIIVGVQPPTYLFMAIIVTIINPVIGPIAIVFSVMSNRAFNNGDLKYAEKWSQYAFLMSMITVVASIVIYIAIGFALSNIGTRGGHSY